MFAHVYRFDPHAISIDPRGQKLGVKYRRGAWKCVMCKGLASFHQAWNHDHAADCSGLVVSALGTTLGVELQAGQQ